MVDAHTGRADYTEPDDGSRSGQESSSPPGDRREAQEPQEPRSAHVGPGRDDLEREAAPRPIRTPARRSRSRKGGGVIDELREAWDRVRGRR